jgi:hypothetical protein
MTCAHGCRRVQNAVSSRVCTGGPCAIDEPDPPGTTATVVRRNAGESSTLARHAAKGRVAILASQIRTASVTHQLTVAVVLGEKGLHGATFLASAPPQRYERSELSHTRGSYFVSFVRCSKHRTAPEMRSLDIWDGRCSASVVDWPRLHWGRFALFAQWICVMTLHLPSRPA